MKIMHGSIQLLAAGGLLAASAAIAQTACHEPAASEFKAVVLSDIHMGLEETPLSGSYGPVGMTIAPDGRIFIAKMKTGEIRVFSPTGAIPQTVTLLGTIPTWFSTEDGLLGIALSPNFATDHWLYAFYSDPCGLKCTNRAVELARFNIANNTLASKKVILRIPRAQDDDHHAAGGLTFSNDGILVIGTGDNSDPHDGTNGGYGPINTGRAAGDAQKSASNTNDLRGKVLRIKPITFADDQTPTPGIGATYDIPTGNLWEFINKPTFNPNWGTGDSIEKVRKEIYCFGDRNPYHPRIDTKSGWIFWGEVGPDADTDDPARGPSGHDEWNMAVKPGFYGHPYCNGYNVPWNMMTSASPATYGAKYNCAATVNNSPNNTGIHHLPPAVPAVAAYTSGNSPDDDPRFNSGTDFSRVMHAGETAIGGPMYRYDPKSTSKIKFPPFFEGKVIFFDWSRRNFRTLLLNTDGTLPAGTAGVHNFSVSGLPAGSYIDMQYGPDGAMYLLKFSESGYGIGSGPQLFRVEYNGVSDSACYKEFIATTGPVSISNTPPVLRRSVAPLSAHGFLALPVGYRELQLFDAAGRMVWSYHRADADREEQVRLPNQLESKLWHAKIIP